MSLFKKGVETYDYTELQKRGLLKLPPKQEKSVSITKDGYFDIAGNSPQQSPVQTALSTPQYTEPSGNSPFSFLDNLAASSSTSNTSNSFSAPPSSSQNLLEAQGLKNKIEDLEYKLERLLERLSAIESKITSFEGGNNDY